MHNKSSLKAELAWWLSGRFGAFRPRVVGSNPTLAAT